MKKVMYLLQYPILCFALFLAAFTDITVTVFS